jgi:chromosomal replication initiation ATPase DnaA
MLADFCRTRDIKPLAMTGACKIRKLVYPRQEFMYLACQAKFSTLDIAAVLHRDHSTVIHGRNAYAKRLRNASDERVAA